MPLYKVSLPPLLYRGHFIPQRAGDVLSPTDCPTYCGDKGSFVFASSFRLHAAAYGYKSANPCRIGFFDLQSTLVPQVLLLIDKPAFKTLGQAKTYLQELAPHNFRAVFPREPHKGAIPAEWVSQKQEIVQNVTVFSNEEALKAGVQVFATENPDIFKQRILDFHWLKANLSSGALLWENLRPDYDESPSARSAALMKRLGVERPHLSLFRKSLSLDMRSS